MSNFIGSEKKLYSFEDKNSLCMHIFEFKPDKMDFFLTRTFAWEEITSMVYLFKMGNDFFSIPSGLYVLLCDDYGTVDCIMIDELIGRDIGILVFDSGLSSPDSNMIELVDAKSKKYYWPNSNNMIPITSNSGKKVILLSRIDQWKSTKDKNAFDFV